MGRAESLAPVLAEAAGRLTQDRVGRHYDESLPPAHPHPRQRDPEEAVAPAHLRPSHRPLVDGELVAQGQVLQGDMAVSAAEEGKHSKQAEQEGDHRAEIFSGSAPPDQSLWRRTGFWRRTRVLARVYLHPRTLGGVLGRFAGRGRPGQVVQGERVWLHDVYWLTNPRFGATASSFRGCQRTSCAANQLETGRGGGFPPVREQRPPDLA